MKALTIFLIALILLSVSACGKTSSPDEFRYNELVIEYANLKEDLQDARLEIAELKKDKEELEGFAVSDGMYIRHMENRVIEIEMEYDAAVSFIETAEYIITNLGAEFYYTGRR